MINPNIHKRVLVQVEPIVNGRQFATYQGIRLPVNELRHGFKKPGQRYMYLKFSICTDRYYLTAA